MIAAYNPFCEQAENFRKLRSQLMLSLMNENRKTLSVVGMDSEAGCSFLAANLSIVFAQLSERTVLVDANLRKPRQHKLFNLEQRQGLSDLLAGRCGTETATKIPGLNNLYVLPAGTPPPNPQELLSRPAFGDLLRDLARDFDIILIDTAAAAQYSDSLIVCAEAGKALLVVRKHQTRAKDFSILKKQLSAAKTVCVGAVLNEI